MSSILDALEKLEAAAPRRPLALGAPVPPVRERRPRLTVAAAFATGALAAAVAAAVLVSRRAPLPPPPAPRPARAAPAPSLPVVPPVPPPAETTAERPWAQVDAPPAAPAPAVATAPPVPVAEAPVPRVHVSFLLYSKVPERRSVALAIEDGGLVTLHEGERTGGVEVARILPDRVELRYDGRTFAVRARD